MRKSLFKTRLSRRRLKKLAPDIIALTLAFLLLILVSYQTYLAPPAGLSPVAIRIESGLSLREITELLAEKKVIRSPQVVEFLIRSFGRDSEVLAGDYFFDQPLSAWEAARRLSQNETGLELIRVTLPEGLTAAGKSIILARVLPEIDQKKFVKLGQPFEGFLFPDTYFFSPLADEKEIILAMLANFKKRIEPLKEEIRESERSLQDIVIMASLLELEARTTESRRMIAGILWKRLDDEMLLQVDAVFPYIIGLNTFQVTLEDLRYDSPYNTYRYLGLPAGAIANPGLDSIESSLRPIDSPFWYYLSDMQGNMHYTITHDDHVRNKNLYLR